jgi:hypothetical protein
VRLGEALPAIYVTENGCSNNEGTARRSRIDYLDVREGWLLAGRCGVRAPDADVAGGPPGGLQHTHPADRPAVGEKGSRRDAAPTRRTTNLSFAFNVRLGFSRLVEGLA